jgi:hypothetical protein
MSSDEDPLKSIVEQAIRDVSDVKDPSTRPPSPPMQPKPAQQPNVMPNPAGKISPDLPRPQAPTGLDLMKQWMQVLGSTQIPMASTPAERQDQSSRGWQQTGPIDISQDQDMRNAVIEGLLGTIKESVKSGSYLKPLE